jgi:hypothetical protein
VKAIYVLFTVYVYKLYLLLIEVGPVFSYIVRFFILQWVGFEVHGFDGPESLAYSMDNAGHRHAYSVEVCAKLMNGALYANANPPADDGDHKEFEHVVVAADVYQGMQEDGEVDQGGWLGYKPNILQRTPELPVSSLKVRHDIYLPCHEINGGEKFRRHVVLPPALLEPGATVYHFLEYKSLPNMEFRARASVLAERAAAEAAAAAANDAENVVAPAAVGTQAAAGVVDAAANDAENVVAPAADVLWQEILQNYHSESDEDYIPDEDEEPEDHDD